MCGTDKPKRVEHIKTEPEKVMEVEKIVNNPEII
jgi:hypothetical protein